MSCPRCDADSPEPSSYCGPCGAPLGPGGSETASVTRRASPDLAPLGLLERVGKPLRQERRRPTVPEEGFHLLVVRRCLRSASGPIASFVLSRCVRARCVVARLRGRCRVCPLRSRPSRRVRRKTETCDLAPGFTPRRATAVPSRSWYTGALARLRPDRRPAANGPRPVSDNRAVERGSGVPSRCRLARRRTTLPPWIVNPGANSRQDWSPAPRHRPSPSGAPVSAGPA